MSAGRTQRALALAREIVTYLVAGGGAAAANFAAGGLIRVFSRSALVYGASVVVGMAVGTVVSFFLHRRFTFSVADEPAAPQAARFALVAAPGGVLIALTFVTDGRARGCGSSGATDRRGCRAARPRRWPTWRRSP